MKHSQMALSDGLLGAVHAAHAGGSDGEVPRGSLLSVNGTLYAKTISGGTGSRGGGCGIVFAPTP